jgi:hypothetical protein
MPPKTADEELAELEMLAEAPVPPPKHTKGSRAPRQKIQKQEDDDALKDLEELEQLGKSQPAAPRQVSRPNTPKVSSSSTTSSTRRAPGVATPSSAGSARTSEDNKPAPPRKSGESTRSFHQSFAPTEEEPAKPRAPEPRQGVHGGEADGEDSYPQPLQLLRLQGSKQKPLTRKSRRTKRLNDGQSKYEGT